MQWRCLAFDSLELGVSWRYQLLDIYNAMRLRHEPTLSFCSLPQETHKAGFRSLSGVMVLAKFLV